MQMKTMLAALIVALSLAGCASPEDKLLQDGWALCQERIQKDHPEGSNLKLDLPRLGYAIEREQGTAVQINAAYRGAAGTVTCNLQVRQGAFYVRQIDFSGDYAWNQLYNE